MTTGDFCLGLTADWFGCTTQCSVKIARDKQSSIAREMKRVANPNLAIARCRLYAIERSSGQGEQAH